MSSLGRQFETIFRLQGEHLSLEKALLEYPNIRQTVQSANLWIDGILLSDYITMCSFLANLAGILRDYACDMAKRARESCLKWVSQKRCQCNLSHHQETRLLAFVQEVETEPVTLSCSFFPITCKSVGSMVGLMITYGLVVFQMSRHLT